MPWKISSARRHTKKARSSKQKRQWSKIANSALKRGASEGSSIHQANAVVGRSRKGETMARKRGRKRGKKR